MNVDRTNLEPGLSVVIPVYNSEPILPELIECLDSVLRERGDPFEILFVNDGSRDHSWSAIEALVVQHPCVRGFNLLRNFGQHNALLCGIRAARYDRIVTMDDDLQNPPGQIEKLLGKLDEGYDVVYGTPAQGLAAPRRRWNV